MHVEKQLENKFGAQFYISDGQPLHSPPLFANKQSTSDYWSVKPKQTAKVFATKIVVN